MNKITSKLQKLRQKADMLKRALDSAPEKAAQFRESVLMTAGQLQQMRADVQSSVTGLRADNGDRLTQALKEINDSAETFLQAGYELTGVDMDISPVQRLIVHLEKIENVSESTLRNLLASSSGRQTAYAILAALAKADVMTGKVNLSNLNFREVVVHVGPTPSIRICWRTDEIIEETDNSTTMNEPVSNAARPTPPPLPAFGQSSYFEPRAAASSAVESVEPAESDTPPPVVSTTKTPSSSGRSLGGSDWKQSALDRFKKMPDASKYRR